MRREGVMDVGGGKVEKERIILIFFDSGDCFVCKCSAYIRVVIQGMRCFGSANLIDAQFPSCIGVSDTLSKTKGSFGSNPTTW